MKNFAVISYLLAIFAFISIADAKVSDTNSSGYKRFGAEVNKSNSIRSSGSKSTSNAPRTGQTNSINKAMENIKKSFSHKNKDKASSKTSQQSGGSRYFSIPTQSGQHDGFIRKPYEQESTYGSREGQHEVPQSNNYRQQEGGYSEHSSFRGRFRKQDHQENPKNSFDKDKQNRLPNKDRYPQQENNLSLFPKGKVNNQRPASKPKEKSWWNFFSD